MQAEVIKEANIAVFTDFSGRKKYYTTFYQILMLENSTKAIQWNNGSFLFCVLVENIRKVQETKDSWNRESLEHTFFLTQKENLSTKSKTCLPRVRCSCGCVSLDALQLNLLWIFYDPPSFGRLSELSAPL